MQELAANPAFRSYAVCSAILVVKMLLTGNYTTLMRMRNKGYVNAEDAAAFWRAIFYFVGYLCLLGMAVQVVL